MVIRYSPSSYNLRYQSGLHGISCLYWVSGLGKNLVITSVKEVGACVFSIEIHKAYGMLTIERIELAD